MSIPNMSAVLRVWLTDGSPIPFTDVQQLNAAHRGLLGLHIHYKGLIDQAVPIGAAIVDATRPDDVLVGEAEWTVLFPDGATRYIHEPQRVDLATPVILQGLIEGKWLNRLLGTTVWKPATLGNNVLAKGPGIATTLGAIEAGASGEIRVEYKYRRAGGQLSQVQIATLADLRGQNVLALVRAVLQFCRDTGNDIDAIDLSAIGAQAAIVTEPRRVRAAMRLGAIPVPNPLNLLPARRFRLMERVVRDIIKDGITVPPDSPMIITTRDQHGTTVGEGSLVWRAARA